MAKKVIWTMEMRAAQAARMKLQWAERRKKKAMARPVTAANLGLRVPPRRRPALSQMNREILQAKRNAKRVLQNSNGHLAPNPRLEFVLEVVNRNLTVVDKKALVHSIIEGI